MPPRVSIIVPTLNEADNVDALVRRIGESDATVDEVIFVDDGSTDGTCDRIRGLIGRLPARLIVRDDPQFGLSGAVLAGAAAASGEIVVVMDADLSHPPESISTLVAPVATNSADMAIGSRYVSGGATPGWPPWRRVMSRLAAAFAYPLTGVHDSMCGFFAIRRDKLLQLTTHATGFKIAFETIMRGGRSLRVVEVPITFRDRTCGVSKMSLRVALTFFFQWLLAVARLPFHRARATSRFDDPLPAPESSRH